MATAKPIKFGPFLRGLITQPDPTLIGSAGLTYASNVDLSHGTLRGFYGPGNVVGTCPAIVTTFLHFAANGQWLTANPLYNFAFDDASLDTQGERVTYRTHLSDLGVFSEATVITASHEYRLGLPAPAGTPTATTGGSGSGRSYYVTFYDPDTGAESNPLFLGTVTKNIGAAITGIPTYNNASDPQRTHVIRRLYATLPPDTGGVRYRVLAVSTGLDPLNNNTTTTFTDGAAYGYSDTSIQDWGPGGYIDNETLPDDHSPPPVLTILPNAIHSVNGGQGGQGTGIIVAGSENWLVWTKLGYPHYWPLTNRIKLEELITAILTADAETFVFTRGSIFSVSGVTDYALTLVKTGAAIGCPRAYGKTAAKTPLGIIYLSDEGLMLFDGAASRPFVPEALSAYLLRSADVNGFACGAYDQGFYYLSLAEGRVFVIDLRRPDNFVAFTAAQMVCAFHVSKVDVGSVRAGLFVTGQDGNIAPWRPLERDLVAGATPQPWQVATGRHTDDQPGLLKRFNRFRLTGSGDVTVNFFLDESATPFHSTTEFGEQWLPSGACGDSITLSLFSEDGSGVVRSLDIETEVFDED